MLRRRANLNHSRSGAAIVEYALVAPLFFLMLGGVIEFGQAFQIEHLLSVASRRGARFAIVNGSTNNSVEKRIREQVAKTLRVNDAFIGVEIVVNGSGTIDVSQAREGDEISVTVSVPYSKAGIGFFANVLTDATLSSNCVFEHE